MNATAVVKILIADDHPLVRLGMETMLATQPDFQVVAQAVNGDEAVRLALQHKPDVVVLDLRMPEKDGLSALADIKQQLPTARFLMLTSFFDPEEVLEALRLGADGFVLKDAGVDELIRAIRAVSHGDSALNSAATHQLVRAYQASQHAQHDDIADLTPSELRVLALLTRGLSNRQLAKELGVSVRTVTTHIRHILEKLSLDNRVQAALYAREHGLTP